MPAQPKSLADTLALLWASEHEQDFEKFITGVDSDRKPSNYTQKTNEELIIAAGVFRLCRWEIVIRNVLEKLDLRWEQANDRATWVTGSFGPATLAWLYSLHPDESLMRFFVGVNLELAEVSREMASRTRQQELRQTVMQFHEGDSSSIKPLLTAVEKEAARWGCRKLFHPYRRADETTDREQTASLKIQENYLKIGAAGFKSLKDNFAVPIPQIVGLPLDQKKETALEQFRVAFLEKDIAHMARLILPILDGEKLPGKAYQALRTEDDKIRALKRNPIKDFELKRILENYSRAIEKDAHMEGIVHEALEQRKFSKGETDIFIRKIKEAKNKKWLSDVIERIIQEAQKRSTKEGNDSTESLDRVLIERRFGVWKKEEERHETLEEMGLLKPEEQQRPTSLALPRAIKLVIERRRTKRTQEATRVFLEELKDHGNVPQATKAAKLTRPTRNQILLELRRELDVQNLPPGKK
jgi:hypothetical protein